jgi:hypothetical protein
MYISEIKIIKYHNGNRQSNFDDLNFIISPSGGKLGMTDNK